MLIRLIVSPPFQPQRLNPTQMPGTVRIKWPDDLLLEGFVPFPKRLLRSLPRLFPRSPEVDELALLLASVDYKRRNVSRQPSMEYLAFLSGLDLARADAALQRLKEKGYATALVGDGEVQIELDGLHEAVRKDD